MEFLSYLYLFNQKFTDKRNNMKYYYVNIISSNE